MGWFHLPLGLEAIVPAHGGFNLGGLRFAYWVWLQVWLFLFDVGGKGWSWSALRMDSLVAILFADGQLALWLHELRFSTESIMVHIVMWFE